MYTTTALPNSSVTSRMGRVSRNHCQFRAIRDSRVTSRMGRVSRNDKVPEDVAYNSVTSRMGRVSRNVIDTADWAEQMCHVPHGACE